MGYLYHYYCSRVRGSTQSSTYCLVFGFIPPKSTMTLKHIHALIHTQCNLESQMFFRCVQRNLETCKKATRMQGKHVKQDQTSGSRAVRQLCYLVNHLPSTNVHVNGRYYTVLVQMFLLGPNTWTVQSNFTCFFLICEQISSQPSRPSLQLTSTHTFRISQHHQYYSTKLPISFNYCNPEHSQGNISTTRHFQI